MRREERKWRGERKEGDEGRGGIERGHRAEETKYERQDEKVMEREDRRRRTRE
jgi:hypothetical protein